MNNSKKFGFWSIVFLTINAIIGTGIFLSPAGVIKDAGTSTPLIYLFAACFAAILAITFASAAKYVVKNGAAYAYTKAAFGRSLGFYVGITRFAAGAIAWGVMATAVVRTTLGIFAPKQVNFQNITIGFLILMAILLLIVFSGTYITKLASNISTIGKVAALVIAIVAGFIIFLQTGQSHFFELNSLVGTDGKNLIKPMDVTIFVGASLAAFYAYTGFESVASAASEMVEPEKNLPRAIPVGIAIVAAIYIGVVSIAMVINPVGVLNSKEPVILASAFANPIIKAAIVYGAVISMFGINIAAAFSTPRVFEAMADEGQLPQTLCARNKRGVAIYAFVITALMAIVVPMAFKYDMKGIMVISSVSRFIQFLLVPLAVIVFYLGKSVEPTIKAKRNALTDVIIPLLAVATSAFLLIKFNWVGQFTEKIGGVAQTNVYAVTAMIVGYIVLPIVLYVPYRLGLYNRKK